MKAEESGTRSTNEANPKSTCQPTKQDPNDMEQPKHEAKMTKKTNKMDTYQQLEHKHNRFFPKQLLYKT